MFTDHELIRIYYAIKADQKRRTESEFADQFEGEIQTNKQIMAKVKLRGLIAYDD